MPQPVDPLVQRRRQVFGQRLRQLREASGFSQEALAAAADIDRKTVVRAETGTLSLLLDRAFVIADALRVEPAELFAMPGSQQHQL